MLDCFIIIKTLERKRKMKHISISMLIGLLLSLLAGKIWGTTIIEMNLNDLTGLSRSIAVCEVINRECGLDKNGRYIFTDYLIRVDRSLKAQLPDTIRLRAIGGELDGLISRIIGIPLFSPGDKLVLFLADEKYRAFPVIGWEKGVFRFVERPDDSRKVMLTHDWQAVTGISRKDTEIISGGLIKYNAPDFDGSDESDYFGSRQESRFLSECMELESFISEIEKIIDIHRVSGFTWKYADLFKGDTPDYTDQKCDSINSDSAGELTPPQPPMSPPTVRISPANGTEKNERE